MDTGKKKKTVAVGASVLAVGIVAASLMGMAPGGGGGAPRGGGMPGGEMEESVQKTVVETGRPQLGDIVVTGSYVGTVEPGQQVTVYPKVSGEVTGVYFSVGDTVNAGDTLFQIDSTSLQLDIAQSQANISNNEAKAQLSLESAQQDLENYSTNAEEGLNSSLLSAEAAVRSAENALQIANNNLRLARQSYTNYLTGDADYDYNDTQLDTLRNSKYQAELNVESAQLTLETRKAELEAIKKSVQEQKESAQTSVKSAELNTNFSADYISLQKLQNNLGDNTSTAPISGVIEQRGIDPYDMASTQSAAFVISNKELVTVTFHVTEATLASMRLGDTVTLEKNGETCTGSISELSNVTEASSGLYAVKATVESAPFEMRSGSTIKLYAETQKVENEVMVPIDAVYYDNGAPYVFVFDNNTARRVDIETGISDEQNIQVVSGLSLSDEIIVTWSANLYDTAEVYLPGTAPEDPGTSNPGDAPDSGELPQGTPGRTPGDDAMASPDDNAQDGRPAAGGDSISPAADEEETA